MSMTAQKRLSASCKRSAITATPPLSPPSTTPLRPSWKKRTGRPGVLSRRAAKQRGRTCQGAAPLFFHSSGGFCLPALHKNRNPSIMTMPTGRAIMPGAPTLPADQPPRSGFRQ